MPAAESVPRVPALPKVKGKRTAKAVSQVMAALKNSRNPTGPTLTEIVKFINVALEKPATKRQVVTALKRGVDFGILKHKRGHYAITQMDETFDNVKVIKASRGSRRRRRGSSRRRSSMRRRSVRRSRRRRSTGLDRQTPSPRATTPSPTGKEEPYDDNLSAQMSCASVADIYDPQKYGYDLDD